MLCNSFLQGGVMNPKTILGILVSLFFTFLLFSNTTFASRVPLQLYSGGISPLEEGFFNPGDEELTLKPEGLEVAYEASRAFPVGWSNCSSSYISPDGYIITAFHCVIAGLGIEDEYKEELAEGAEIVVVPQEAVIGKTYKSGNLKATVVAAGEGFGQFDERLVDEYDPSVLQKIQDVIGTDWAILKLSSVKKKNHACLVAAPETPAEGDYNWAIGYPADTIRDVGQVTNNRKKLVSFGKVAYSADGAGYYNTLPETKRDISRAFWKDLVDAGIFFISDADSQGGNSGSPAINDQSQLIGLLVQGLMPDQQISYEKFHAYSTGMIDLQFIRYSLGEEAFNKYFTCGLSEEEEE